MKEMSEKRILLDKLKKILPQIDLTLSEHLSKNFAPACDVTFLLLHLSQATRAGHLCIKIEEESIFPQPEKVWEMQNSAVLSAQEWQQIKHYIKSESQQLPPSLSTSLHEEKASLPSTPLCRFQQFIYFQKHWVLESSCLHQLDLLLNQKPAMPLDPETIQSSVNELVSLNKLLPEQARVMQLLEKQSLTLIAGGPGTGKTYTAGQLIKIFWKALSLAQRQKCRIMLAAPTGKGASNLQKSLGQAVAELSDFPSISSTTIHALLGIKQQSSFTPGVITADLLIIDECSMIDIRLMSQLLKSLKPGARLVLLGDPYQLPPVGAGSFFSDMIKLCPAAQMITLDRCLRSDLKEIVGLASEIKKGNCQEAFNILHSSEGILDFKQMPDRVSALHFQHQLLERGLPHLLTDDEPNLDQFQRFCILSPLRKGPLGVDQLNQLFFKEMAKRAKHRGRIVIPIMILNNDPKRGLFNGDTGYLIRHHLSDVDDTLQVGDFALFHGKKIAALHLPRFEYAYCLSVHKSQGSEFDHVLLLLPEGSEHFGRELLYTAVTRAKKKLEIWNQGSTFETMISHSVRRLSRIQ